MAEEIDRRGSVDYHKYTGLLRPPWSRATEGASDGRRGPNQTHRVLKNGYLFF